MTTEEASPAVKSGVKALEELILQGDADEAARSVAEISRTGLDANDMIDEISDAMNIVVDLHEVNRFSAEQVERSERAAERALVILRPRIRVEQRKLSGLVMVASLEGDPHSFDKTLLTTMLEIGGFTPLDGGSELSPQEMSARVADLDPDVLAVPLATETAAEKLVETTATMRTNGVHTHVVAYGRGASTSPARRAGVESVEEDSLGALRRITEFLISKK